VEKFNENSTLNAETNNYIKVNSHWHLSYLRLKKNRYGMFGFYGVIFILFLAVFAEFLSPHSYKKVVRDELYHPPQVIHFIDNDGSFHFRPFVYKIIEEMDMETYEFSFFDSEEMIPIKFFIQGDKYSIFGINLNIRLFGNNDGNIHLLGTDNMGRDILSRMLTGTQITLLFALIAVSLSLLIGLMVGISSGYFGGTYDLVAQRVTEFALSFPAYPLYFALVALLPRRADETVVFILFASIIVLLNWASIAREIRGKTFLVRNLEFVRAARALGASRSRIMIQHIFPNTLSHVIVWTSFTIPSIILVETFLSFLGVGVQHPMVSWGVMLNQVLDIQSFAYAPWMMAPVGMIIFTVLAFNAFGDGIRDAVDPYAISK
jgi:peptide/nickel transport system permease protein|tara:strand:- start:535 stop:1662 length:1128 start_codon:yes stop_codon:yes gene_type:complete